MHHPANTHLYCDTIHIRQVIESAHCTPKHKYIKKMCYIYTKEYYLAMKKYEIVSFAQKWIELEIIRLSKISQTHKEKYHMFSFTCGI
jgi:hypothetical protein